MKHSGRFLFLLIICFLMFRAETAFAVEKQEVISQYEQAVSLAEELDVYQQDVLGVVPKIRLAGNSLLHDDLDRASRVLQEALSDLELIRNNRPNRFVRQWKLEWLEVLFDLVQKYALLVLLGLLFAKWNFFARMISSGRFTLIGSFYFLVLLSVVSIFFSLLDISRYGASAWAFFDVPLILTITGGWIAGPVIGALLGIVNGGFRMVLNIHFFSHFLFLTAAGLFAGLISKRLGKGVNSLKPAFGYGFLAGLANGFLIYSPMLRVLTWPYLVMTACFLAVVEGGGVLVLNSVMAGVFKERSRRQTEKDLLTTQLLFLQAQIRPHFIFNALNAISAICGRENAPDAQKLIVKLAGFLRGVVKRNQQEVTVREEKEYIENYLAIENVRFGDRLAVDWEIDLRENFYHRTVPILVLQPIVENAVQHGIAKKENGGKVRILMSGDGHDTKIEVTDDGVGMTQETLKKVMANGHTTSEGRAGIGLSNIHKRLIRMYGAEYGLKIISEPGRGTTVTVRIPFHEKKIAETA